jgi:hypothetical protein
MLWIHADLYFLSFITYNNYNPSWAGGTCKKEMYKQSSVQVINQAYLLAVYNMKNRNI